MAKRGPKTPLGKRIAAMNSLRHGLNSSYFLLCKKDRCVFIENCLLRGCFGDGAINAIEYGDPCPEEVALFQRLYDGYCRRFPNANKALIEELRVLAMLQVCQHRRSKMSASTGTIERVIPGRVPGSSKKVLTVDQRYRFELSSKILSKLEGLFVQVNQ